MKKTVVILTACIAVALIMLGANYLVETTSITIENNATKKTTQALIEDKRPEEWKNYLFPKDEVIEIRINLDEEQYNYMVENASQELYVPANMEYNGIKIKNIGIRPKGNSSLRTAIQKGDRQFSFRLELDEYVYQTLYGITAINLNNCMSDPSYIREIMSYEIIEEIGLPAPERVFCNLYINNELIGLYLAVQQIDEVFTSTWFNDGNGDLYKPEGIGADLSYIDDNYSSYSGLGVRTHVSDQGKQEVVTMIKALKSGENLEDVLYTDLILKYHAVNTALLSLDSYMGGMFHNYYLYGEDGKYMIIPWDYNMSFGGFGTGGPQVSSSDTQFYIDEPTAGTMADYPLVNALLTKEVYLQKYHEYLNELLNGPLELERFTTRAEELTALIDSYVKNDPDPMSSYEAFKSALYETTESATTEISLENPGMGNGKPLITFVQNWTENITKQLSGELASSNNGEGSQVGMIVGGTPPGGQFPRGKEAMSEPEGMALNPPRISQNGGPPQEFGERQAFGGRPPEFSKNASNAYFENPMQPPQNFPGAFEEQQSTLSKTHQASIFTIVDTNNLGQYFLITIIALFIIFLSWLIKKKG